MEITINAEIVKVAQDYIGQKEILGNLGFIDSEFERRMKAVGWKEKEAWCSYFSELVWKQAYSSWDSTLISRLDKLFSGSAVATFGNFKKAKDFITGTKPVEGAVVLWQNYTDSKPSWTGHAGIVESFDIKNGIIRTIEGNTNDKGGREGYIVSRHDRALKFDIKNGLVLLGFVTPKLV